MVIPAISDCFEGHACDETGEVRKLNAVGLAGFVFDGDGVVHGLWIPADLRMARAVPTGRSFSGAAR